ncbi:MAG TPA: HAD family hydrolase [Acidimicrobiales bacterium]|nr:HAD family hydrolase [Acidimicrobiales bacterium]
MPPPTQLVPTRRRLVLFDLDNTLADREAAFSRWAQAFAAQHGLDEAGVKWLTREDEDGLRSRQDFFAVTKAYFRLPYAVEELVCAYRHDYTSCYHRDDVSIAVVTRLRRLGLKVAVVTNGEPTQADKVRLIGIAGIVDAVCISSLVGARKPARAIFAEAARRCAVPLSGWMVGDSPEADIRGACEAGLTSIWLDRGRTWPLNDVRPDFSVASISGAADIIARSLTEE